MTTGNRPQGSGAELPAIDYETTIESQARRLAEVLAAGDPYAPVPTCPQWT